MNAENTQPQSEEIDETVSNVAKETMVGDLRDVCLQIIRDPKLTGKAWKDMTEAQQRDVAQTITDRVSDAVVRGVQIIAANGQRQIIGTLEQVVVKDGIKAVLKCSQHDELRHELMDAAGDAVAIVLTGAEEFIGVGEKVKIDKDQPDLVDELEESDEAEIVRLGGKEAIDNNAEYNSEPTQEDADYDEDTGEFIEDEQEEFVDQEVEAIDRESAELT